MLHWTTPEQLAWLQEQVPQWREASLKKRTKQWLTDTVAHFLETFPISESDRVKLPEVSLPFGPLYLNVHQLGYRELKSGSITIKSYLNPRE